MTFGERCAALRESGPKGQKAAGRACRRTRRQTGDPWRAAPWPCEVGGLAGRVSEGGRHGEGGEEAANR